MGELASLLRESAPTSETSSEGDSEAQQLDAKTQREGLRLAQQNREERKRYASRIFKLVRCWLYFIGSLLLFQGFLGPLGYFALTDAVLIAVSTTTTASVTAILIVVARHLFPNEASSTKPSRKK